MKNDLKKLMACIVNQLKMIVHQEIEEKVYNDNSNFCLMAIQVNSFGSVQIKLSTPQNEKLPILSLEIYCEKSKDTMRDIFDKIIKLIDNKIYKVNSSENLIALHWQVNFDSKNEVEIDFIKFSRILPRVLIILKDLGLFQLRSYDSIINSTADKYFRNNREKNINEKSKKKYLIRRDMPAILPNFKSDYYF